MTQEASTIETREDMLRAFRFPRPQPRDFLLLFLGAVLLGVVLRLLALRKPPPPAPAAGRLDPAQRRSDFRVPAQLPAEYLPEGSQLWFEGTICDLSAGGVTLMIHNHPAPLGRLSLRFQHGENSFENLPAVVVRADEAHWSRSHYLHCRFVSLGSETEHRLSRAVAERERELLRRTRPRRD